MYKRNLSAAIILSLTYSLCVIGQQEQSNTATQSVATVREVKGRCLVRDNESTKAKELKVGDQIKAGQEVQCATQAHVKIRFAASGGEKDIGTVRPDWYVVPNVPASIPRSAAKIAGRIKGRGDPTRPEPTPIIAARPTVVPTAAPAGFDAADMYWKARPKSYLLVAASKTNAAQTDLPFTKVDAQGVAKALVRLGYEPLGVGLLEGTNATEENFVAELQKIRSLPKNALVIVYYSGHAFVDPSGKDLWLQLYGQKKFGDHFGLSIDNLLGAARGQTYKGELSLILDTCFSGAAGNSAQLKESDNTVIVASSSYQQPSVSMVNADTPEMSAFTFYFIKALTEDWSRVDDNQDGIIMYADLGVYIGNRLKERFYDRTLLGEMQPQLFGGFKKNWLGYDTARAINRDTEPRRAVLLERASQLQDPDITKEMLSQIAVGTDSYLRALHALDDKNFDEAMELLEAAEKDGRVSLAQIDWARANVKMEQNQFGASREWLDKAIDLTRDNPNFELISYAAGLHFMIGSWPRAEELFKQALILVPDHSPKPGSDEFSGPMILFALSMINMFQGDKTEADLYLKRLKEIDPKTWAEDEEQGAELAIPMLEIMSDLFQDKVDDARRKLKALRQSATFANASAEWKGIFDRLATIFENSLNGGESSAANPSATAEHFHKWDTALKNRDVQGLLFLLSQTQLIAANDNSLLKSKESDGLLARTVAFAHERKNEHPTYQTRNAEGMLVTVVNDQKDFAIEAATLLVATGQLYAMKGDTANAEKVLKEGIALEMREPGGAALSFGAVVQVANIYQEAQRYAEAESQLKNLLKNLRGPLGDESLYGAMAQSMLGKVYEAWNRPEDAEPAYREALRLALTLGKESFFAIEARQTLGDFLQARGNNEEASQLYETAIRNIESDSGRTQMLSEERNTLYFSLSKTYYQTRNFQVAETLLKKTYDLFSNVSEPDISNLLDCLEWQWATAIVLKKQTDADVFYRKMSDLIEPEMAKPQPDATFGDELKQLGDWFKDWDIDKSEHMVQLALKAQEKIFGAESWQVGDAYSSWASIKEYREQTTAAMNFQDTALRIYEKQTPSQLPRISYIKYSQGYTRYLRGEFSQARTYFQESADMVAKLEPINEDFFRQQWSKYMLGVIDRHLQNYERAQSTMESVLTLNQNLQPLDKNELVADTLELAAIFRLRGNTEGAQELLTRAASYIENIPADRRLRRQARLSHERGMLMLGARNMKEAESLLRDAIITGSQDRDMDRYMLSEWMDDLAQLLRQRKKDKEAVEFEKNAKQIRGRMRN